MRRRRNRNRVESKGEKPAATKRHTLVEIETEWNLKIFVRNTIANYDT